MEKANAWCWRGRVQRDVLYRSMRMLYSSKDIQDAEPVLVAAGAGGQSDIGSAAQQTVKARLAGSTPITYIT
eukprot:6246869-Pyramimonas_sp.AAC.1